MSRKLKLKTVGLVMSLRKMFYRCASTNNRVKGRCSAIQAVVINGIGQVVFGENVQLGVINSPRFYSTYTYIEARTEKSAIRFGNNVRVNNQFTVVSELEIVINDDVLIGWNCAIFDSNFHDLDLTNRKQTDPSPQKVIIGKNVFIGNNVTILKGVTLGENSVVATGSIVAQSFPPNVLIGGAPAKIIRALA